MWQSTNPIKQSQAPHITITNEKDQAEVAPICKNSYIYLNETKEKDSLLTLIHVFCCS